MNAGDDVARPPASAEEARAKYAPLPRTKRKGIGLCLSGGGFRAALFHLGALRRLNELGLLTRNDFRTVSAVSGGAIAAAALADALTHVVATAGRPLPREAWDREVQGRLRAFTRKDARTAPLLKRLLPWNLWSADATVDALAARFERGLTRLRLASVPSRPEFLFLATDLAYGVAWVFSRGWMGDYQAGYSAPPPELSLGRAVAASACFPPLFGPLRLRLDPSLLKGGSAARGEERDRCVAGLRLTDGGAYDNMALEPVWKNHAVVLVSDAGGLFSGRGDRGLFPRMTRFLRVQERQARGLRKRWLIASFAQGVLDGAYWGVGSSPSQYDGGAIGYSKELAR
ncbi:MAG TPA: patatin-like phospholipase family protein, partial [Vicinamibacteria bacterium]|nr:patatin-like phospholipase family protein [Vicinamibacteria bacterium]